MTKVRLKRRLPRSHLFLVMLFPIALIGCVNEDLDTGENDVSLIESGIYLGSIEPDYQFPWVVEVNGQLDCHGVLLGPHWVLTAAHCNPELPNAEVSYRRTSPSGVQTNGSIFDGTTTYVHPQFDFPDHDLALIHLRYPLDNGHPDPYLRHAELPTSPAFVGQTGTIASTLNHNGGGLPSGTDTVWRGSIYDITAWSLLARSPESSACKGDSGSGFITSASGRTTVTGIASFKGALTCDEAGQGLGLAAVYDDLDWIGSITKLLTDVQDTGDFNGDGKTDILWRNGNGGVAIWFMSGVQETQEYVVDGTGSPPVMPHPGSDWQIQGTGDFNGDGKSDILWRNVDSTVTIWSMNGATIQSHPYISGVGNDWRIAGTGDFNGNGKTDILWRNNDGRVAIWLMSGVTWTAVYPSVVPGNDWQIRSAGDFNGDGKSDILWRNNDGTVAIWLMNGAAHTPVYPSVRPGNDWQIKGTGDFNDDGKTDILWRNNDGTVAIWLMNGAAHTPVYPSVRPGNDWQIEGTGDFNANGKHDILWRNTDHTVGIWFMNGGIVEAQTYPYVP